ncbi:hypothetical protein LPJ62_006616 [Coemansia sp. RSA 2167]|nr:hypothetical protein LPJ62_006616 [Coemansia sp. RSA 2167]
MIADAKRTHMHSGDNFQFSAIPGLDNDEDDDSSDDEDSDKSTDGPNDPLIKRCAYVNEIVANLEGVLEKFKRKAQAVFKL